jgi:hypothetical protein
VIAGSFPDDHFRGPVVVVARDADGREVGVGGADMLF